MSTYLLQQAAQCLSKKGESRDPVVSLLKQIEYLKSEQEGENAEKIVQQFAMAAQYHFQAADSFLFHKGQYPDYVYILLEGEGTELIEKEERDIKREQYLENELNELRATMKSEERDIKGMTNRERINYRNRMKELNENEKIAVKELNSLRDPFIDQKVKSSCGVVLQEKYFPKNSDVNKFKEVQRLNEGNVFGRLACYDTFQTRRNNSVLMLKDSRLCSIKLSLVFQLLKEKQQHKMQVFNYFSSFNIAMKYSVESDIYSSTFQLISYKKNDIINSIGDKEDQFLYLILSGSFTFKYFDSTTSQYHDLLTISSNNLFGCEVEQFSDLYGQIKEKKKKYGIECTSEEGGQVVKVNREFFQQCKSDLEGFSLIAKMGVQRYEQFTQKVNQINTSSYKKQSNTKLPILSESKSNITQLSIPSPKKFSVKQPAQQQNNLQQSPVNENNFSWNWKSFKELSQEDPSSPRRDSFLKVRGKSSTIDCEMNQNFEGDNGSANENQFKLSLHKVVSYQIPPSLTNLLDNMNVDNAKSPKKYPQNKPLMHQLSLNIQRSVPNNIPSVVDSDNDSEYDSIDDGESQKNTKKNERINFDSVEEHSEKDNTKQIIQDSLADIIDNENVIILKSNNKIQNGILKLKDSPRRVLPLNIDKKILRIQELGKPDLKDDIQEQEIKKKLREDQSFETGHQKSNESANSPLIATKKGVETSQREVTQSTSSHSQNQISSNSIILKPVSPLQIKKSEVEISNKSYMIKGQYTVKQNSNSNNNSNNVSDNSQSQKQQLPLQPLLQQQQPLSPQLQKEHQFMDTSTSNNGNDNMSMNSNINNKNRNISLDIIKSKFSYNYHQKSNKNNSRNLSDIPPTNSYINVFNSNNMTSTANTSIPNFSTSSRFAIPYKLSLQLQGNGNVMSPLNSYRHTGQLSQSQIFNQSFNSPISTQRTSSHLKSQLQQLQVQQQKYQSIISPIFTGKNYSLFTPQIKKNNSVHLHKSKDMNNTFRNLSNSHHKNFNETISSPHKLISPSQKYSQSPLEWNEQEYSHNSHLPKNIKNSLMNITSSDLLTIQHKKNPLFFKQNQSPNELCHSPLGKYHLFKTIKLSPVVPHLPMDEVKE